MEKKKNSPPLWGKKKGGGVSWDGSKAYPIQGDVVSKTNPLAP